MDDYPFPFWGYGYDADRSVEHVVEVRFATFVDFVDRPALAKRFEESVSDAFDDDLGCGVVCAPWVWSRDWLLLRFRQTDPAVDELDYPLATCVGGILESLHDARPLAEAVALCTPEGWSWPWHDESVAGGAQPTEGPSWAGYALPDGVYARRPRFEAEPLVDAAVEAERRRWKQHCDEMMGRSAPSGRKRRKRS